MGERVEEAGFRTAQRKPRFRVQSTRSLPRALAAAGCLLARPVAALVGAARVAARAALAAVLDVALVDFAAVVELPVAIQKPLVALEDIALPAAAGDPRDVRTLLGTRLATPAAMLDASVQWCFTAVGGIVVAVFVGGVAGSFHTLAGLFTAGAGVGQIAGDAAVPRATEIGVVRPDALGNALDAALLLVARAVEQTLATEFFFVDREAAPNQQ